MSLLLRGQLRSIRLTLLGLFLASALAFGGEAYGKSRFVDCEVSCGTCQLWAYDCEECSSGGNEQECWVTGSGCSSIGCECSGGGWECTSTE